MPLKYKIRPEIKQETIRNHPALRTKQGGLVLLDNALIDLWRISDKKRLEEIIRDYQSTKISPFETRAALACLAEAGLLLREPGLGNNQTQALPTDVLVSAIIVGFNSRAWLEKCIPGLLSQTLPNVEMILVDNASSDGTVPWMKETYPEIKVLQLEKPESLAQALNLGAADANGEYFLIMNPDVVLEPATVATMLSTAHDRPDCAAVAAKLKLSSNPAFLNGIGNYVGPASWGTDYGLGQLDLGQFDRIKEVPSACFAATLIPSKAYKDIGPFDPGFPLYYEDSEWCYRARLYGYKIFAAPFAIGYHAFSDEVINIQNSGMNPTKLQQVTYGRLRFITKLLNPFYLMYFLVLYFLEDSCRLLASILQRRWHNFTAIILAWFKFFKSLREILNLREEIQSRRKISDRDLFLVHRDIPMPLMKSGTPILTWDIIQYIYLPFMLNGQTKPLPEFKSVGFDRINNYHPANLSKFLNRVSNLMELEGFSGLIDRIFRSIQLHFNRM
jgi:GT2 family glycosyltransferase